MLNPKSAIAQTLWARAVALAIAVLFAVAVVQIASVTTASAQNILPANVHDALKRLHANVAVGGDASNLSDYDRALLFKYNDDINAAALNDEIADSVYQAAQSDYAKTNEAFASAAATDAKADFTPQVSNSDVYSPGTDSDYITVVERPEQITQMQEGYNNRVNDYLEKNGLLDETRKDWHNKLDTDFMADPSKVSPEQFEEISRLNNDAYKRPLAADYERISRMPVDERPKITMEHITAYTEEMDDFRRKKGKLLDKLLSDPSNFSDPKKRAEAFRAMAQQQKYISRIESAEDFLRAQEGLPPRDRSIASAAKKGSKRSWKNSKNIRDAYQVADNSLSKAIGDMTDTLADAAEANPKFKAQAANRVAELMDRLPEGERAKAMERIKSKHSGFADEVAEAIGKRRTGLAAADDLKGAGQLDDAARKAAGSADDLSKVAKLKNGFKAAGNAALTALGGIGVGADVYMAGSELKTVIESINKAMDPSTPEAEADALFEKAAASSQALIESGMLGILMEKYPPVAAAFGTWVLTRHGGEWVLANTETGQAINRGATNVMDIGMQAAWGLHEKMIELAGGETQQMRDDAQIIERCVAYTRAIDRKEIFPKEGVTAVKICQYIREGKGNLIKSELLRDKSEVVKVDPCAAPKEALTAADALLDAGDLGAAETAYGAIEAGECAEIAETVAARNTAIAEQVDKIAQNADKAAKSCDASVINAALQNAAGVKHPTLDPLQRNLTGIKSLVERADTSFRQAKEAVKAGRLGSALSDLHRAKSAYDDLGDKAGCEGQRQRVAVGISKVQRVIGALDKIDAAMAACDYERLNKFKAQIASLKKPTRALIDKGAAIPAIISDCEAKDPEIVAARANADCKAEYGSGYSAGKVGEDGSFFCLPNRATANAWCNKNNKGGGWVATKVRYNGTFNCQLSKAGRNAACRRDYGSGYYAGKARKDGSYNCYMGKTARNTQCRSQYGAGWYSGKLLSNGQFYCYPPKGANTARRNTPSSRNNAADAAAAAAIAGAIITGIIATQRSGGGGGNNCHRNPTTGQMHCGSN
ncbi:hypothetical protein [Hoeflea sp. TYP-13]|uniref:hypothetical protein n=1 Tax=Hoeflea sp. TYP-13 TaxID=3230023 RepID=UPI0034C5B72A